MADIEKLLDGETEKRFLKLLFPGFLATWPALLSTIKYITVNKFWAVAKTDSTLNIALFAVLFIAVYGIGHLLNKIALRIEVKLDDWYCRTNKQGVTAEQFDKTWYTYLEKTVVSANPPVIIKYYSGFVVAYQFELTCQIAVLSQLILMFCFDLTYGHFLSNVGLIVVSILSIAALLYLLYESSKAVGQAHFLRTRINALSSGSAIPPPSVSGIQTSGVAAAGNASNVNP